MVPFPWWPPHTLKAGNQHGSQHGTQHGPPRYLSHGDLPHFVFLLLLVALAISFLVCWCLLIFVILSCCLFFLSSLSGFLPVAAYFGRLCDEHGTQHISKNKSRPFLGGVLVSVLSPRQTWNLNNFQNVSATRNENWFGRKSLTWIFEGERLKTTWVPG